jgi:hypothetical protein
MPNIFKNENLSIDKKNEKYLLTIKDENENTKEIIEYLTNYDLITLYEKTKTTKKVFKLNTKIRAFNTFLNKRRNVLTYDDSLQLFYNISTQIIYFKEKYNKTFSYINPKNIVLVGDDFLYLPSDLYKINNLYSKSTNIDKSYIQITDLTKKNKYMSPEMLKIQTIPNNIHYKSCYYSLATVISYYLTTTDVDLSKIKIEEQKNIIKEIRDTPLYFSLLKCLDKYPEFRVLLII